MCKAQNYFLQNRNIPGDDCTSFYSPKVGLTMPFTGPYGKKRKNGKSFSPRRA